MAEDVTFRLQEVLIRARKHSKRCRRSQVISHDFAHVLDEMGQEPIIGVSGRGKMHLQLSKTETIFVSPCESVFMTDFKPDTVMGIIIVGMLRKIIL